MLKKIFLYINCILFIQAAHSTTWGGPGNDYGYQVIHTSDNGCALLGQIENQSADIYLVKLDSLLNVQWTKTYGNSASYDTPNYLSQLLNNGYLIAGTEITTTKASLLKLNSNGDSVWNQSYGSDPNSFYSIVFAGQFSANQYVVGIIDAPFTGGSTLYLCHTDTMGNVTDTLTIVNGGEKVLPVNNGFLITGTVSFLNPPAIVLSRLDTVTLHSFTKTYYDTGLNRDLRAYESDVNGNGFLTAGASNLYTASATDYEFYLINTDADGDSLWSKHWGNNHSELLTILNSGNYFYSAASTIAGAIDDNMIMKLNNNGDTIWIKHLGENLSVNSILETTPGYFTATGDSMDTVAGTTDIWLMQFDSLGNILNSIQTGIIKNNKSSGLEISPNPASDFINVSMQSVGRGMPYHAQIVDSNGRVLKKFSVNDNAFRMEIKDYKSGTYFIQLINEGGNVVAVKKFFKETVN